jgi:5,10-methylenetetrahydromethanopterin reductase
LAAIATQTKDIAIGSGIVNVYSRTPAQLAMGALTLDNLSSGRFTLGLGASSKPVVCGWHGMDYEDQLKKVRNCVEGIRAKSKFLLKSISSSADKDNEIPIVLAGVQRKMILLAKQIADGVLFFLRPLSSLKVETLELSSPSFSVNSSVVTCVSSNTVKATSRVKHTIAFYITYGTAYRKLLIDSGVLSVGTSDEIRSLWLSGNREAAANQLPFETLGQLAIFGTPEESRRKIEEYSSVRGLENLILQFNAGEDSLSDSIRILGRLIG